MNEIVIFFQSDTVSEDAKFTLLIWDFEYLKTIVTSNLLSKKISDLKLYNTQLSIIIYCSADQLKYVYYYSYLFFRLVYIVKYFVGKQNLRRMINFLSIHSIAFKEFVLI